MDKDLTGMLPLPFNPYLFVLLVSSVITLLMLPIKDPSFLPNNALLYVLLVVLTGSALGQRPAILAALISSLLYAHVFVPPPFFPGNHRNPLPAERRHHAHRGPAGGTPDRLPEEHRPAGPGPGKPHPGPL
ncbi:DUF4118 domain-containing protein [Azovibrio restrictus]|uniref:DUF4118 domain-containing protein n=1 Tax=Azovibrio restrictus TaxID=146938 RepID=UPI0026EF11A8|nr:DUF4118 domain-containing protein [Azovibrio restrictus]